MASEINKQKLLELVIESLTNDLQVLIDASIAAKTAATDAEAKPENKYDTRGLEQSYLAAGQARRANELKESIEALKSFALQPMNSSASVDVGSIVHVVSEDDEESIYFIVPQRGGIRVKYQGVEVSTLTPDSILGEKLLEKTPGDNFDLHVKNQARGYGISKVY